MPHLEPCWTYTRFGDRPYRDHYSIFNSQLGGLPYKVLSYPLAPNKPIARPHSTSHTVLGSNTMVSEGYCSDYGELGIGELGIVM